MLGQPINVPLPLGGVSEEFTAQLQPPYTTPYAVNVRGRDPRTGRRRLAVREGLTLYANAGSTRVQDITHVAASTAYDDAGALNSRIITAIAVVGGDVKTITGGTVTTVGEGVLSSTAPVVFSTHLLGALYFVDGTNYVVRSAAGTVAALVASAGSLPSNGANTCRLCCTWRTRLVFSGLVGDDHNWFMTCAGDATDLDYSPDDVLATQAVAGNNTDTGRCPDKINTLIPYSDLRLIFGCDSSIWVMDGDPMDGGRISLVSNATGMAFGRPWAIDPAGMVYFFGSRGGVFRMSAGGGVERISDAIDERLADIDLDAHIVRLAWNDRARGLHVYVSPLTEGAATHYFWDEKAGAWWLDRFADTDLNPVAVHTFDGDAAADRTLLLGSEDGQVYALDPDADDDAGTDIASECWLGPVQLGTMRGGVLQETQAVVNVGPVDYAVHVGDSADGAFEAPASFSGTWTSGRSGSERRRARGDSLLVKLSSADAQWSVERMQVRIKDIGRAQRQTVEAAT